jgi:hypothetical protein
MMGDRNSGTQNPRPRMGSRRYFGNGTVWLDCSSNSVGSVPPLLCQDSNRTAAMLTILASPTQNESLDTVSGFAIVPALASVYYDYAPRLPWWDKSKSDADLVLGWSLCPRSHCVPR